MVNYLPKPEVTVGFDLNGCTKEISFALVVARG